MLNAVKNIMNKIKLYGPINNSCEASLREDISPVLSLAALIAEDIMMEAKKMVSGLRGLGSLHSLFLYGKSLVVLTKVSE